MSTHETPSSSSQDGAEPGDRRSVGEQSAIELGVRGLRAQDVIAVARREARVELAKQARARVAEVRRHIDALADDPQPVYGISTGFGALANQHIPQEKRTRLQKSLVRSHAAGMGPEVEREVVRALCRSRWPRPGSSRWSWPRRGGWR